MTAQDSTFSIHRSAARFFSGTLLSRFSGLFRDIALAYAFGTESTLATFMVAFRFAHLARRLFGEGSLQNTFIPHFEELRVENPKKAFSFFRDLGASLILVLVGLIAVLTFLLFLCLKFFSLNPTTTELLSLTSIMLPSLLFICLFGLNAALLECEKSYFTPSVAPVAFNLVWIVAALALAKMQPDIAVYWLSFAVVIACLAQWAYTLPKTFAIFRKNCDASFWKKCNPFSADVKKWIGPLFLANLGVAASQINNALDPLFALFADAEGPAWLWYAIRIQQLPLALFGIALSGALLPPLARAIKNADYTRFDEFFLFATRRIIAFTLPITFGILATAPSCVNLLFGRGHFDENSIAGTSVCLLGYGLGLLPMAFVLIAAPALYAFGDYKTPTRSSIASMVANIAFNALFVFALGWGAASVAVATSFAALLNSWHLSRALAKRRGPIGASWKRSFYKVAFASSLAAAAVWLADYCILKEIPTFQVLRGLSPHLSKSLPDQLFIFGVEASVFAVILLIAAKLLNVKEILELISKK